VPFPFLNIPANALLIAIRKFMECRKHKYIDFFITDRLVPIREVSASNLIGRFGEKKWRLRYFARLHAFISLCLIN
jgi:hypothetical protein